MYQIVMLNIGIGREFNNPKTAHVPKSSDSSSEMQ